MRDERTPKDAAGGYHACSLLKLCIHVYEERRAVSCYEGTQKMQKIMNIALLSKGLLSMIVGHR